VTGGGARGAKTLLQLRLVLYINLQFSPFYDNFMAFTSAELLFKSRY
jgi:hypothetical protein